MVVINPEDHLIRIFVQRTSPNIDRRIVAFQRLICTDGWTCIVEAGECLYGKWQVKTPYFLEFCVSSSRPAFYTAWDVSLIEVALGNVGQVKADLVAGNPEVTVPVCASERLRRTCQRKRAGPKVIPAIVPVILTSKFQVIARVNTAQPNRTGKNGRYLWLTRSRIHFWYDVPAIGQIPPAVAPTHQTGTYVVDGLVNKAFRIGTNVAVLRLFGCFGGASPTLRLTGFEAQSPQSQQGYYPKSIDTHCICVF